MGMVGICWDTCRPPIHVTYDRPGHDRAGYKLAGFQRHPPHPMAGQYSHEMNIKWMDENGRGSQDH